MTQKYIFSIYLKYLEAYLVKSDAALPYTYQPENLLTYADAPYLGLFGVFKYICSIVTTEKVWQIIYFSISLF